MIKWLAPSLFNFSNRCARTLNTSSIQASFTSFLSIMVVSCSVATSKILYPFRLLNLLKSCRPTLKSYAILAGVNYPLTGVPSLYCYTAKLKKKRKKRKRERRTLSFVPFPKKPSNLSRLYKKRGALALWVFFLSDLSQIKDQAEEADLSSVSRDTSCLCYF